MRSALNTSKIGGSADHSSSPGKKSLIQHPDPPPQLFRGFVGGTAFMTKKGFRGEKLDSLWSKFLFTSFETDDEELAAAALESVLADVHDTVADGYHGAAFSIGDYGFYSDNQFDFQADILYKSQRKMAKETDFLSAAEWEAVDRRLQGIATHGKARFREAYRGDTFANLAIRCNSFHVARKLLEAGIDPCVENEEGHDLFLVCQRQYGDLGYRLKEVQEFKLDTRSKILVPSEIQGMILQESRSIHDFKKLSHFADVMKKAYQERAKLIERDRLLMRKYALKDEDPPAKMVWNVGLADKVDKYILLCDELKVYIKQRLENHRVHSGSFENMSGAVLAEYNYILAERAKAQELLSKSESVSAAPSVSAERAPSASLRPDTAASTASALLQIENGNQTPQSTAKSLLSSRAGSRKFTKDEGDQQQVQLPAIDSPAAAARSELKAGSSRRSSKSSRKSKKNAKNGEKESAAVGDNISSSHGIAGGGGGDVGVSDSQKQASCPNLAAPTAEVSSVLESGRNEEIAGRKSRRWWPFGSSRSRSKSKDSHHTSDTAAAPAVAIYDQGNNSSAAVEARSISTSASSGAADEHVDDAARQLLRTTTTTTATTAQQLGIADRERNPALSGAEYRDGLIGYNDSDETDRVHREEGEEEEKRIIGLPPVPTTQTSAITSSSKSKNKNNNSSSNNSNSAVDDSYGGFSVDTSNENKGLSGRLPPPHPHSYPHTPTLTQQQLPTEAEQSPHERPESHASLRPRSQEREDLYAKLGISSGESAKLARAQSGKLDAGYAPVLGKLRETEDTVVFYR